jgi:ribosomal protein L14E/L6E/L27E
MAAIQVGRKAVLTRGRRAGEQVEITKVIDANYVMVKTKKGKERKCNAMHLHALA